MNPFPNKKGPKIKFMETTSLAICARASLGDKLILNSSHMSIRQASYYFRPKIITFAKYLSIQDTRNRDKINTTCFNSQFGKDHFRFLLDTRFEPSFAPCGERGPCSELGSTVRSCYTLNKHFTYNLSLILQFQLCL